MQSPLKELKILIADDDKVCQIVLRTILEKLGHQTTTTSNGIEAVSIVKNQDFDFAFAFIDLYMPGITGDEAARQIKEITRKREQYIKVIITTAHDFHNEIAFGKPWIDGVLNKPICKDSINCAISCQAKAVWGKQDDQRQQRSLYV